MRLYTPTKTPVAGSNNCTPQDRPQCLPREEVVSRNTWHRSRPNERSRTRQSRSHRWVPADRNSRNGSQHRPSTALQSPTEQWIMLTQCCRCCHDEPVSHCLYGGTKVSRRDDELHQTESGGIRLSLVIVDSHFIDWGTTQGRLSLPTADVLSTIVKR